VGDARIDCAFKVEASRRGFVASASALFLFFSLARSSAAHRVNASSLFHTDGGLLLDNDVILAVHAR